MISVGLNPIIIDTRPLSQTEEGWIPRAQLISTDEINQISGRVAVDQHIIPYCACPNEVTATKVAKLIINNGFFKV